MNKPLGNIERGRASRPRLETTEVSSRPLTISPTWARPSLDGTPSLYAPPRTSLSAPSYPQPMLVPRPLPSTPRYTRPRGLRIMNLIKPLIPIILYGMTSIGFVIAIAFWKSQVFHGMSSSFMCTGSNPYSLAGLDDLSHWIKEESPLGYVILFTMIVITTIRKCSPGFRPRADLRIATRSSCTIIQYAHYLIWLYFRCYPRRRSLVLRRPCRRYTRLSDITILLPRVDHEVAHPSCDNQTCRPRH
jgi:hypothetical protein